MEFLTESFADTGDSFELVLAGESHDIPIEISNRLSAVAVGSNFKRVVAFEFEQQGNFLEDLGQVFASWGGGLCIWHGRVSVGLRY
jgi:hypothetical protein